jgi:hypothetical protein
VQDASHTKASLKKISTSGCIPVEHFANTILLFYFSIENFHPLHAAEYRLLWIWHHLANQNQLLVWINFLYGELVIWIEVRFFV